MSHPLPWVTAQYGAALTEPHPEEAVLQGHRPANLFTAFLLLVTSAFAQDPVAKGIEEFHQGKYDAATSTLEQALKHKPGDAHARTFLALSSAATGGFSHAAPSTYAAPSTTH